MKHFLDNFQSQNNIFSHFFTKTCVVGTLILEFHNISYCGKLLGTYYKHLIEGEALLVSTYNICFCERSKKNIHHENIPI